MYKCVYYSQLQKNTNIPCHMYVISQYNLRIRVYLCNTCIRDFTYVAISMKELRSL